MKKTLSILALGLALGFVGTAGAKDKAASADKPLKGKITKIAKDTDGKSTDITVAHHKDEATVVADDSVTVTVDGESKKVADLTVGEYVTITPATGKPVTISATSAEPKKKAK